MAGKRKATKKAAGQKRWMQGAVKRPGAATRKAKREGLTVLQWARKHQHDKGLTGQQARFVLVARKVNRSRK